MRFSYERRSPGVYIKHYYESDQPRTLCDRLSLQELRMLNPTDFSPSGLPPQKSDCTECRSRPKEMVYAFRVVGEVDETWYGDPDELNVGALTTSLTFEPDPNPSPFAGKTLEFRYGDVLDDEQPPEMQAYVQVENDPLRKVLVRADIRDVLFPGHTGGAST